MRAAFAIAASLLAGAAWAEPPVAAPAAPPADSIEIEPTAPDAPVIRAVLSGREVRLGEVFLLLVDVDHPPGVEVNLPAALPLGLDLEETARTDRLVPNPGGGLTRRFEVALMAFALGEVAVPPLPVTWTALGQVHQAATPALALTVVGALGEGEASLRDIAPPVAVVIEDRTLLWIGAAVLAVVLGALIGARIVHRRRRRPRLGDVDAAGVPLRSVHEEALARLAEVEASGALDADDRKPVYLMLSEIARAYAGRRFGIGALDLTTTELRARLAALPDPGGVLASFCDWLERCDLVKYARSDASEDEARQALYEARIFVERTREGAGDEAAGEAVSAPIAVTVSDERRGDVEGDRT